MLIEFRVKNHRSLRDEQVLTFEEGRIKADDDRSRSLDGCESRLLPVAALYGANASGKSNVLAALEFMRESVAHSHRLWAPDSGVPREPFAWEDGSKADSAFVVIFVEDGCRYEYGFVANDARFQEEWLFAYPRGRKQSWFERDGDSFKFGEHLHGENRLVEQVTRPNALFLSAAAQHNHAQLDVVHGWFRRIRTVNVRCRRGRRAPEMPLDRWLSTIADPENPPQSTPYDEPCDTRAAGLRELLLAADVGIVNMKVESSLPFDQSTRRGRVLLQHRADDTQVWLPLEEESQGTVTLLRAAPALLDAIHLGSVVVVDELEASLHPLLAQQLIKQFNDPRTNPKNAQLLFATHDTRLLGTVLGEPALRRDQVWMSEKDAAGATHIYPLTNFQPRKSENLERGYLQGRYGAIPYVGEYLLRSQDQAAE